MMVYRRVYQMSIIANNKYKKKINLTILNNRKEMKKRKKIVDDKK